MWNVFSLQKEPTLQTTLTSDVGIPQQGESKCLLVQATKLVVIYYGVPRKLMQSYGPKNLEQKTDPHFTGQETEVQSKELLLLLFSH